MSQLFGKNDNKSKYVYNIIKWLLEISIGCALFAFGFDAFLEPTGTNAGGLSGLAMVFVRVTEIGTVGLFTLLVNIPLFLFGGKNLGRKFFFGSLLGSLLLSTFIDAFNLIPGIGTMIREPLLGSLYGGVLCGAGLGLVFLAGASTGGSDIIVRLLKLKWRNFPIGKLTFGFDLIVVILTGIVFHNITNMLYCGITIYVISLVMDAVIYRFDYSTVAIILSKNYEQLPPAIAKKLDRGSTFLYAQGSFSKEDTKAVMTAVKKNQVAELKELVHEIDPNAFVITQESHQVLGEGFAMYSPTEL